MLVKLTSLLKKYLNNGSILDYGCGKGSFLATAEKHGFTNNVGIDVSEYSTSIAKSMALKSNFYNNKENLQSNKFDCLSFIDSIAHIQDINIIFSELISNNLNDDGVILIRTPNINRMYILYSLLIGYIIPKRYLNSLFFLPNRLFLFNIKSIELFLNRHGLEIQEFFLEPEFTSIPYKFQRNNFFKSFIVNLIRVKIPNIINKNNSLTLIAKIKT